MVAEGTDEDEPETGGEEDDMALATSARTTVLISSTNRSSDSAAETDGVAVSWGAPDDAATSFGSMPLTKQAL